MEFNAEKTLNAIIPTLFEARYQLSRGSALYAAIEGLIQQCAQDLFGPNALQKVNTSGIGDIYFRAAPQTNIRYSDVFKT